MIEHLSKGVTALERHRHVIEERVKQHLEASDTIGTTPTTKKESDSGHDEN